MPKRADISKILIIGSGPIVIGQACEFDYSGTQACKALRKLGYEIVLVNSNPATIMTDTEIADITYIEPLNLNRITDIIAKERTDDNGVAEFLRNDFCFFNTIGWLAGRHLYSQTVHGFFKCNPVFTAFNGIDLYTDYFNAVFVQDACLTQL